MDDYEFLEKLGSGSYSTVYKGLNKTTREIYAIKCVEKQKLSKTAVDNIITEIGLLKKLKHKHIVEMKEFQWDSKNVYIVMEYCNAGDLYSFIKKKTALPETTCKYFLRQLGLALKYMRSNNVSHFDLKPQNLLLTRHPVVTLKVADFGFAQHLKLGQENTTIKGSPLYMAPEILLKNCYDASADLWSIGVILFECLFGKAPYSSKSLDELLEKVKIKQKIELPPRSKISPECEDLLTRLLKHDPKERMSFDDFFNHEFLDLSHMPSDENMDKAVALMTQAVEADTDQNYEQAYHLYCQGLQYFVPIIHAESDASKKQALRARTKAYLLRAEEIKHAVMRNNIVSSDISAAGPSKEAAAANAVHSILNPNEKYQQLYSMSSSSPDIQHAMDIGRQGEMYLYEKKLLLALESFKSALSGLMPLLNKEPKGARRDLLHQQIVQWMNEAESIKSILSAHNLEHIDTSTRSCCIQ